MPRNSPPASNQDYGDNVSPPPQVGSGGGTGTVTNIATTAPITGGPITTTGTIGVTDFVASGASHARGTVPDPGAVAGTTKFLREDATWATPAGSGTVTSVGVSISAGWSVSGSPVTSSGTIALTAPLTTKGDVYTYSTQQARLAVGSDTQVLTADSTTATGLKWATPASGGGLLKGQEFTSSGTFNVPAGVTSLWITMVGGGGGGASRISAFGGGGGGAGESCDFLPVIATASGTVTVTIGAGGAGATAGGADAAGSAGGTTSFGSYTARGGSGGSTALGGGGGGYNGGAGGAPTQAGTNGTIESFAFFGGCGGSGGTNDTTSSGGNAQTVAGCQTGAIGGVAAAAAGGGGAGASTRYGAGGAGGNGAVAGSSAASTSYGAGGGGAGGKVAGSMNGGSGAAGYVLVQWIS